MKKYAYLFIVIFVFAVCRIFGENIKFVWDNVNNEGVSHYNLYVKTANDSIVFPVIWGTPVVVQHIEGVDSTLQNYNWQGDTWIFAAVTAVDTAGNESGFGYLPRSYFKYDFFPPPDTTPPSIPAGFRIFK